MLTKARDLTGGTPGVRIGAFALAANGELFLRTGILSPVDRLRHVGNWTLPRDADDPDGRRIFYCVFTIDLVRTRTADEYEKIRRWDPDTYEPVLVADYLAGSHNLVLNRLLRHGKVWFASILSNTSEAR
jgi:hypothetical protein